MTDDQFDRLFKKASFKALNPSLLTLTKKNIVIKNALNRLQTLLKIDLLDLRTFIPFMTNDQLSQFGDKLGMISIKSCLTSEQVGFCLETGKILVRDLNDVELNRAAKFLSNSNLNELNVSVRDQLRLNNFTPAQILNNWSLWNRHQRRSIDLSDWSVEQVLMLSLRDFEGVDFRRIQLSTWDLLNAKLFVSNLIRPFQPFTLTCFDWSEELFEALFPILSKPVYAPSSYDLDISECYFARWNSLNVVRLFSLIKPSKMKELSNAFIERNISFIPKIYLLSLNPDLKKLNYANLSDDCIRKLFHNVRPDLLRDLPLNIIKQHLTKIPNLNFLSSRTLERMDFNDFPFEILLELTSFSSICYKLYEIRLYRFTQDQITSLFDIFGVERFNVSRYVNFISLADYPRFTLEQCRSIQFDKLSFEQKMAFKQSQLKVMYGYSSYKNQNSSESYSHEIPKDNSYSVTSKQVEWQTTIQKVRAYFASGALSPVTNDAPTQFFTLRNLIINSNNLTPKEVLEVLMPNFSDPDKAFKKGSPFIHPDRIQRNGGSTKLIEEANELFKVLNEARSILAETKNRTNF